MYKIGSSDCLNIKMYLFCNLSAKACCTHLFYIYLFTFAASIAYMQTVFAKLFNVNACTYKWSQYHASCVPINYCQTFIEHLAKKAIFFFVLTITVLYYKILKFSIHQFLNIDFSIHTETLSSIMKILNKNRSCC